MQDTWGIPGPTFLAWFIGGMVVIAVLSVIHRKVLFRGKDAARVADLGPQQVAYLRDGDWLAIYAAIGGLRAAGAIGAGPEKTLAQTGSLPAGATPLDTAVYNAAGRRARSRDLENDQWVRQALDQMHEDLERRGLANSAQTRRTARLWAIPAVFLLLIGIARLVDGIGADKPVGYLLASLGVAAVLLFWLARKAPLVTAAANRGLASLRQTHHYLAPQLSPSYATYGVSGAAMGVALFGAASLHEMDPAFAAEMEIRQATAASGGAGASCGSSASCGGGGGGGSSCGGGGGCGG